MPRERCACHGNEAEFTGFRRAAGWRGPIWGGRGQASTSSRIGIVSVVVLVPIVVDLIRSIRTHIQDPDLVPIWEERRATVVPILSAALSGHGVQIAVRGAAFLNFWQVFVPYAPIQILVEFEVTLVFLMDRRALPQIQTRGPI